MRHWPPTSGVLVTFLAANGGTFLPSQATGPTIVLRLVAAMVFTSEAESFGSSARLRTSTATSNSECTKPIGCVHCLPESLEYAVHRSPVDWPVSDDLKGWFGDLCTAYSKDSGKQ